MYSVEEFDKGKTKVLKYILYKRRTENEVRTKFQNVIDEQMLEDIIEYLKQAKYIDDKDYIDRLINNFKILKSMSQLELRYKLIAKGLSKDLIEDYMYEKQEIVMYLMKKGYKKENINKAFDQIEKGEEWKKYYFLPIL